MMLSHMGETHTDGIPVQCISLFDFDISTWMLWFYIQRVNWSCHCIFTKVYKKMLYHCAQIFKYSECKGCGLNFSGISM